MTRAGEISAVARRRRERERNARRESILAAARDSFAARGFIATTMEEVALRAEITKPTLYGYFRTKDEILLHLMLPIFVQIGEHLEVLLERLSENAYGNTEELIEELIDALLSSYQDDPERFRLTHLLHQTRLIESLDGTALEALDLQGRADFRLARAILREAMDKGLIRNVPVGPLADVVWGIVVGVIQVEDIKNRTGGRAQFLASIKLAGSLLSTALAPETA
ncbi:TetR/AcrR family transcriptional regulator [Pseudonocardia spinosispora]|uniref:TetR/AcrR family transcriptional regulator n=1 Tax=Pseudonocardia spinosispora TaxID=103441 RepID=UPI00146FB77F|nr:TetR/AcrR family transcriptional regulator [Pseudonocardia spinosispora]